MPASMLGFLVIVLDQFVKQNRRVNFEIFVAANVYICC